MAAHQCPNCGGYKTYSWWTPFTGQVVGVVVMSLVAGGLGLLLVPMLVWAWFKKPAGLWPHCCRICEYSWVADRVPPRSRPASQNLLHLGNALLEEEAAAAAANEERRRRR